MNKCELKECPFCGNKPELVEYHETCDGRGDFPAHIRCDCHVKMFLTLDETAQAERDLGFRGGYYSQYKKFWDGMHQRLIDKWNHRI